MSIPFRKIGLNLLRALKLAGVAFAILALVTTGAAIWGTAQTTLERPAPPLIVNDVTQLNPITVSEIVAPTTIEEIVHAVKSHSGPISIGGGRYSMGGQTATPGGLQIDMRGFNRILAFDSAARRITVQPGIRWRQIQERIDPANLSVKIMQTYSNFTVGGSLSVNVHGRYVGLGPLIMSVRSIKVVLADGRVLEASPRLNAPIFYGAIGGYGGLGVIVEATLDLAENVRVKRVHERMPVTAYHDFFFSRVRDSSAVVFHNADIYPPAFSRVNALSYIRTEDSVTVPDRLIPQSRPYRLNRTVFPIIAGWPGGKAFRQYVVDPFVYRGNLVTWRNYEASYDVAELEPSSRESSTYVLQEYFVPVERFDEFIPKMRDVFQKHDVNVINVSIRHAKADPGSLLAWAPREVFAFVIYYRQDTDTESRRAVGVWTREMTDAVLSVGGSYYLPYQPHATESQFLQAYPRAPEYFALKKKLDPDNKFRNTLWDKYYSPTVDPVGAGIPAGLRATLDTTTGYRRDEGQTFLTHPEWYIVYSSEEYADWMRDRLPTDFPYLESIGQFWVNYAEVRALTRNRYPWNPGYHVMLGVIGSSYSAELTLKALYENTVGRFSGWTAGHQLTDEDRYAYAVARDYGTFIHTYPWYLYSFSSKLGGLWSENSLWGPHVLRKWERRVFLTLEYGVKAMYATLIEKATQAAYAPEDDRMKFVAGGWPDSLARADTSFRLVARLDQANSLVSTPRYDGFRDAMGRLAAAHTGVRVKEIAGNDRIFVTGIAPADWQYAGGAAQIPFALLLPSDKSRKRVAMIIPARNLLDVLGGLRIEGKLVLDHVYDY